MVSYKKYSEHSTCHNTCRVSFTVVLKRQPMSVMNRRQMYASESQWLEGRFTLSNTRDPVEEVDAVLKRVLNISVMIRSEISSVEQIFALHYHRKFNFEYMLRQK